MHAARLPRGGRAGCRIARVARATEHAFAGCRRGVDRAAVLRGACERGAVWRFGDGASGALALGGAAGNADDGPARGRRAAARFCIKGGGAGARNIEARSRTLDSFGNRQVLSGAFTLDGDEDALVAWCSTSCVCLLARNSARAQRCYRTSACARGSRHTSRAQRRSACAEPFRLVRSAVRDSGRRRAYRSWCCDT